MRVGVLSDIHIDRNASKLRPGQTYDRLLAELIHSNELDCLLLAGDIASDYHDSIAFLDKMKSHRVSPIYFVPGNHDFWSIRNGETDTQRIYQRFLEREECTVGRPVKLTNSHSLVANPGWYDYGYASKKYTLADFENKKLKFGGWNDRLYVHWEKSDKEVAAVFLDQIEEDLRAIETDQIILMTHVATNRQFTIPLPNRIYDYYNAFLGAKSYERLYQHYPISHSVMGHVHFRKRVLEEQVDYVCACLGNSNHWWTDDVQTELAYTLERIDL